jgi:Holliday junction resolvasome RuvABC DNA-binding subunit
MTPAVDQSTAGQDDVFDDALSALTNLGYRSTDAKDALKTVRKSRPQPLSLQELIRETLKHLARV